MQVEHSERRLHTMEEETETETEECAWQEPKLGPSDDWVDPFG